MPQDTPHGDGGTGSAPGAEDATPTPDVTPSDGASGGDAAPSGGSSEADVAPA